MPLRFRNVDVTPDDPVESWGFEGMLAAMDRGYAVDWRKLIEAVFDDPVLRAIYDDARDAAESEATVILLDAALAARSRSTEQEARERLRAAFRATGLTHAQLAGRLGTSRPRMTSYLSGSVTPAMDVLVAIEAIARERRAPLLAAHLELV
ncbi:helix-turn-helix transcriptional regulator [Microbacterium sp. VKM Ac-2923]|uniref:helix-turn-helix domain-containing protein n=1 Tax=Microbacterium sp. VKM Ac-2923 TaxID=2929476 RepID=UPI001FB4E342|nr:helix-turn-helix transcriptional regulator [Microbacterium sp. VKM Ac-2923]MCJ1707625.1 helix-turn-helix domain-containing protein [Microbacterium sp. VKM Ac-2923]